jgi:hypothetical protein
MKESRRNQSMILAWHVVIQSTVIYPMGTGGGGEAGVKRPGHEADHSPAASVEVKNAWSYTSTLPYVFIA